MTEKCANTEHTHLVYVTNTNTNSDTDEKKKKKKFKSFSYQICMLKRSHLNPLFLFNGDLSVLEFLCLYCCGCHKEGPILLGFLFYIMGYRTGRAGTCNCGENI